MSFTGVYLTAAIGLTSARFDITPTYSLPSTPTSSTQEYKLHGGGAPLLLGAEYLYQFKNKFVLGVEWAVETTSIQASHTTHLIESFNQGSDVFASSEIDAKYNFDFSLIAKPGYVVHEDTLFYGLIGPRFATFDTALNTLLISGTINLEEEDSVSGFQTGFTVGAGVQQRLTDHLHLNLEYLYTSFGEIASLQTSIDSSTIESNINSLMLNISYQWRV